MAEIRTLTALRGIAALWVVLYHYNHHFAVNLGHIVRMGDLAVDLFFTLSGFIMVYVYRDRARFVPFMVKRFARLYPVHLVTLAGMMLMLVAAKIAGLEYNTAISPGIVLANLLVVQGWGVIHQLTLNYPSWSISAEFSAYLLFPALAGFVLRGRLGWMILVAVAFWILCAWVAEATGRPIYLRTWDFSPIRILPEFLAGMVAARIGLETHIDRRIVLTVAIAGVAIALGTSKPLLFIALTPVVILALFLWERPLPVALNYLGKISYSLYMVHALVEKAGFTMAERLLGSETMPLTVLPVMIGLVLLAAALLYHFVEEPGRHSVTWMVSRLGRARMASRVEVKNEPDNR